MSKEQSLSMENPNSRISIVEVIGTEDLGQFSAVEAVVKKDGNPFGSTDKIVLDYLEQCGVLETVTQFVRDRKEGDEDTLELKGQDNNPKYVFVVADDGQESDDLVYSVITKASKAGVDTIAFSTDGKDEVEEFLLGGAKRFFQENPGSQISVCFMVPKEEQN